MKQVERVSVGGYAFTMEGEAAAAAGAYLDELQSFYNSSEIMEGIEERMAELMLEKTGSGGVVSESVVSEIIDILGRPERLESEDAEKSGTPSSFVSGSGVSGSSGMGRKKLYRDREHGKIGGVLSGLACYFGVDVPVFRVIAIVLMLMTMAIGLGNDVEGWAFFVFISVPLIYLILWVSMPAAKTARQKWEQRGEDGSVDGIRRSVESGAGKVGDALRDVANAPMWGTVGRVLEVFMGLVLLITAVSGLFGGALAVFGWQWLGLGEFIQDCMKELTDSYTQFPDIIAMSWVKALAALVYTLPFIGMLYGSILMLFRFKAPSWHPGLWIFVLWLIALVAAVILILACVFSANWI